METAVICPTGGLIVMGFVLLGALGQVIELPEEGRVVFPFQSWATR
jgi:hypothetical protein